MKYLVLHIHLGENFICAVVYANVNTIVYSTGTIQHNYTGQSSQSMTAQLLEYIKKEDKHHKDGTLDWIKEFKAKEQSKHFGKPTNTSILSIDFNE